MGSRGNFCGLECGTTRLPTTLEPIYWMSRFTLGDSDLILSSILLPKASYLILLEGLRSLRLNEEVICTNRIPNVHLIVIRHSLRERVLPFFMLRLISFLLQVSTFCSANLQFTLIDLAWSSAVSTVHYSFSFLTFKRLSTSCILKFLWVCAWRALFILCLCIRYALTIFAQSAN